MTERPIIFSAPMVRAILAGTKTRTRRILKPQPLFLTGRNRRVYADADWRKSWSEDGNDDLRYAVGDRLWVRESFRVTATTMDDCQIEYGDGRLWSLGPCSGDVPDIALPSYFRMIDRAKKTKGRTISVPSIHMPRWASRVTLEVTAVKVERLQEISVLDARDEGVAETWGDFMGYPPAWAAASIEGHGDASGPHIYDNRTSPENFRVLWESIHGPGAWEANPWVAAVTFRRAA